MPELGFASVGFPDESMDCDLIFEVNIYLYYIYRYYSPASSLK